MTGRAEALRYAVRFRVLAKYFGQLCVIIAALTAVPMIVCLLYGDYRTAAAYLAAVGVLSAGGLMAGRLAWKGRIQNPDYEEICRELGLTNTILPSRTISQYLADMVEGIDTLELSRVIKDTARFFNFIVQGRDAGKVSELDLPDTARVICFYRDGRFHLARDKSKLRKGDEVLILTDTETLKDLEERWKSENSLKTPSDQ